MKITDDMIERAQKRYKEIHTANSAGYVAREILEAALDPKPRFEIGDILHTNATMNGDFFYVVTGVNKTALTTWGAFISETPHADSVMQLNESALRLATREEIERLHAR